MTPSNKVAILSLAKFIEANAPSLKQVLAEWPDPKVQMDLPSVSVLTVGNPVLTPLMPTIYKVVESDDPTKRTVVYLVGHYDSKIQLDLWTEFEIQRDKIYEEVMAVFDKQFRDSEQPNGISLELLDYHNGFAHYDIVNYTYMDNEDASSRSEWRVKIDVQVNYPRFVEKTESIMAEIRLVKDEADTSYDINENYEV